MSSGEIGLGKACWIGAKEGLPVASHRNCTYPYVKRISVARSNPMVSSKGGHNEVQVC